MSSAPVPGTDLVPARACLDCNAPVDGRKRLCLGCKNKRAVARTAAWRANNLERRRKYERERYAKDPSGQAAATKRWREANPEKVAAQKAAQTPEQRRNWTLRSKYGITLNDERAMLAAQGGRCGICADELPETGPGRVIDHDHETGAVRGLLCRSCNLLLGHARDDLDILAAAMRYLEQASQEETA